MHPGEDRADDHLSAAELTSFLYDSLPEDRAEPAQRHLERCPYCRERLRDIEKRLFSLDSEGGAEPSRTGRGGKARPLRLVLRRHPLAPAVLVLFFVVGMLLAARYLPADRYRVVASVGGRVDAGQVVPVQVRVQERSSGRPARDVSVQASMEGGGSFEARTDAEGLVEGALHAPAGDGLGRLRVVASSMLGRSVLEVGLPVSEERRLVLSTNRFRYRPGEVVAARVAVVAREASTRSEAVTLQLLGPDGIRRWMRRLEPGPTGAASATLPLDPAESPGLHLLEAESGAARDVLALLVGDPVTPSSELGIRVPGGTMRSGMDNEVLVRARNRGAKVRLDTGGEILEGEASGGVARFLVRPRTGSVELRARVGPTPEAVLSVPGCDDPWALSLRVEGLLVPAGSTLACDLAARTGAGPVVVEVRQGERSLARRLEHLRGRRQPVALEIPAGAAGLAEVVAWRLDAEAPLASFASRRILILARGGPEASLATEREAEADTTRVRMEVRAAERPVAAAVGLSARPPGTGPPGVEVLLPLLEGLPALAPEALANLVQADPELARELGREEPAVAWFLSRGPSPAAPAAVTNPSVLGESRLDPLVRQGWAVVLIFYVLLLISLILTDLGRSPWAAVPVGVVFLAILPALAEPAGIAWRPTVLAASLLAPLLVWASSLALADLVDDRLTLFSRTTVVFLLLLATMGVGMEEGGGLLDWGLALLVATGLATAFATLARHREDPGPLASMAGAGLAVTTGMLLFVCVAFPGMLGAEVLMLFAQTAAAVAWASRADAPWPTGPSAWEPVVVLVFGGALFAVVLSPNLLRSRAQAQVAACRANLRTLSAALDLYARDSEGLHPPALGRLVPRHLQELPACPAAGRETYSAGYLPDEGLDSFALACRGLHHADANLGRDRPELLGGGLLATPPETTSPPPASAPETLPGWRPDVAADLRGGLDLVLPIPPGAEELDAVVSTLRGGLARVRGPIARSPVQVRVDGQAVVAPGETLHLAVEVVTPDASARLRASGDGVQTPPGWKVARAERGRALFVVEVRGGKPGPGALALDVRSRTASVQRVVPLRVAPRPRRLQPFDGGLAERETALPVPAGRLVTLRAWRDAAAQLEDALASVEAAADSPGARAARLEIAALGIQALRARGASDASREERLRRSLERALQAVLSLRRPDGRSAPPEDPLVQLSLLRALAVASHLAPVDPRVLPEAALRLAGSQQADGSWGGDRARTAEALLVLSLLDQQPEARRRGLAWLRKGEPQETAVLAVARLSLEAAPHSPWSASRVQHARERLEESPAEALEILRLAGGHEEEVLQGLRLLARRRRADGGWGAPEATLAAARGLASAAPRLDAAGARLEVTGPGTTGQVLPEGPRAELSLEARGGPLLLRSDASAAVAWQLLEEEGRAPQRGPR